MTTTKNEAGAASVALGHRHGLKQPCLTLSLSWSAPASVDWAALDAWLLAVFRLKREGFGCPDARADALSRVQALAARMLALSEVLLQAARVPAFETGRLLQASPSPQDPERFDTLLAVPCAGVLLQPVTTKVHRWTASLLLEWCAGARRSLAPDALCEYIDAILIKPLAPMVSGGKSTIHILRAAHAQGMPLSYLGGGQYQVGWGARARRFLSSSVDSDSAIGARAAQNKQATATMLRLAGLPAPEHLAVQSKAQAIEAARRLGWPLVVKPVDRDRGEGVVVDIDSEAALVSAFEAAIAMSKTVLVERMVPGVCHRIFVAKGEILFAAKRHPKSVVGDGVGSVAALTDAVNAGEIEKLWWDRSPLHPRDEMATACLARQGMEWESRPTQGTRVLLRPKQNTLWGGDFEAVTDTMHPANAELAIRAAALFGLDVAGVDLITPDLAEAWHRNGAVLNEINPSPMLPGGPISKPKMPQFLQHLVPTGGRFPVSVFVGDASAWEPAKQFQADAAERGVRCYATSHRHTLGPEGQQLALLGNTLLARCQALLLNQDVEELVLLVHTDEMLHLGLPVDAVDSVVVHSREIVGHADAGVVVPGGVVDRMVETLQARLNQRMVAKTDVPQTHPHIDLAT